MQSIMARDGGGDDDDDEDDDLSAWEWEVKKTMALSRGEAAVESTGGEPLAA